MPGFAGAAGVGPQLGQARAARLLKSLALAIGLTFFTAIVFLATLAVTMPASVLASLVTLPPQVEALSGSAWRGRASLAGGHVLNWRVSARQAWRLRLVADATLMGPETRLEGVLAVSPWQLAALDWTGRASPSLLALLPGLPVTGCTSHAVVEVERLAFGSGTAAAGGEVGVSEGSCADLSGEAHPVPAMVLDLSAEGRDAQALLSLEDGTALARLGVTGDRRLIVQVEPAGAALVPGMPTSAPISIEYPF